MVNYIFLLKPLGIHCNFVSSGFGRGLKVYEQINTENYSKIYKIIILIFGLIELLAFTATYGQTLILLLSTYTCNVSFWDKNIDLFTWSQNIFSLR